MMKQLAAVVVAAALAVACTQESSQAPAGAQIGAAPGSGAAAQPDLSSPIAAGQTPAARPGTTGAPAGASPRPGASPAASEAAPTARPTGAPLAPPRPSFKEVTIPSGTTFPVTLDTAVASDTSKVEDAVRGKLARAVVIDGTTVVPSGSAIAGSVTQATPSGKVKGLAALAFRFERLTVRSERLDIQTARNAFQAEPTKKDDATKIGIGAGAGAVIGAIAGGAKGAAIGTAIGGGAGAGVVVATKGDEVRLGPGAEVSVTLQQAVTLLVPID